MNDRPSRKGVVGGIGAGWDGMSQPVALEQAIAKVRFGEQIAGQPEEAKYRTIEALILGDLNGRTAEEWLADCLQQAAECAALSEELNRKIRLHGRLTQQDARELADQARRQSTLAHVLASCLSADGATAYRLVLQRRKRGNPHDDSYERANRGHRAAGIVERLVKEGMKQEAALAQAREETGLSRFEIMSWKRYRRAWAEYEAAAPQRSAADTAKAWWFQGKDLAASVARASKEHGIPAAEIERWLGPLENMEEQRKTAMAAMKLLSG